MDDSRENELDPGKSETTVTGTVADTMETEIDSSPQQSDTTGADTQLEDLRKAAQAGSAEHQYLLGKHHYDKCEGTEGAAGNDGQTAVSWLIKASKQGHEPATELLTQCCHNKIGVTDENLADVHWCLHTPQYEKTARQAAQKLFQTLNPLQEGDKLTKQQFKDGISKLGLGKKEKKMLEKAGKLKKEEVDVSEQDFVEKLIGNLHGYGGMTKLWKQDVDWEAYTSATWFQKMTKYPGKTLSWMVDHMIDVTGREGMTWLKRLIPTNQIYMLMIFFVYSLLSVQVVFWFLPLFVFYISLITMVVCTMQMFYTRRKTRDIKALGNMLKQFNETLNSESAESAYSWNSLTPYIVYFIALITTVCSFLMADKTWIPCSEMTFVAAFFTVGCFFALSDKYDHLIIISMILDNISTLPSLLEGFPKIPVLYHILSFFFGAGFTIELLPDMYFQIGIPSLAYLAVPFLFIRMARQSSWQGTYRVLIPHLVCFFWWRLAMLFLRHSSWLGLFRASIGWISFIVLLPFLIVFLIISTVMYFSSVLTWSNVLKIVTTFLLLAIPALFAFWAKSGFEIKGFKPDLNSHKVRAVLAVIFTLSVLPMAFLFAPPERDVKGHYMTWEQYRHVCSQPHWEAANMADAMVTCSQFTGTMVDWTGQVKKIVVKNTENQAEGFIDMLPWALANWLKCTYGEEYPECNTIENEFERVACQINKLQGRSCHMENLNRYGFEIWLSMPLDNGGVHDVRVEASHWFKDTLLNITQKDQIRVRASLKSELGNFWPVLKLYHVKCETCPGVVEFGSSGMTSKLLETYGIMLHVKRSFQGLWNFFLAPVVEFYHHPYQE